MRTYISYKQIVDQHLAPSLGKVVLTSLRPDVVQRLMNGLAAKGLTPRTVRNIRAALRRALNQAVSWRYLTYNPAVPVETPRIEPYQAQPLTKEEARRFLDAVKGHRLEVLYHMALLLGLREGELLGLLTEEVDLGTARLRVTGTLQSLEGKLMRETTKTRASNRTLPIPPSLVPLLREHIQRQRAKWPECPYLFASRAGTPIGARNLIWQFKELLKKAGLPDTVRFHDLRHTTASLLVARGENPRTVMEILRHTQISTTMNIYSHALPQVNRDALNSLGDLVKPQTLDLPRRVKKDDEKRL